MASSLPHIIIVPGAWHKVAAYSPLTTRLEQAGFTVHPLNYPSTAEYPTNADFTPDVELVHNKISELADDGREVVVVVHSAGGIIGSEAVHGLSKTDREIAGLPGGVIRMFYMAAFMVAEGETLKEHAGPDKSWFYLDLPLAKLDRSKDVFYTECLPEQKQHAEQFLTNFAAGVTTSKQTYAAWRHIKSTYLLCEKDACLPPSCQEYMLSRADGLVDVVKCAADHSPFLSMPDFTANAVVQAIKAS